MTVSDRETDLAAVVEELGKELPRWQVPGLQLALVREGKVLFAVGVGVRGWTTPHR